MMLRARHYLIYKASFPGGTDGREPAYNIGDLGLIPGSGRSPGEGSGNLIPVFLPGVSHGQRSLLGDHSLYISIASGIWNTATDTGKSFPFQSSLSESIDQQEFALTVSQTTAHAACPGQCQPSSRHNVVANT